MRLLFVSAQMPGHLDWGGYLSTGVELQNRGHDLLWASGIEVEPLVESAQIPFHRLAQTGWRWPPPPPLQPTPHMDQAALGRLKAARALDQWLDETRVAGAVTELHALAQAHRPDLIVSEMFVSAAGIVAEMLNIPFVVAGWPALQPPSSTHTHALAELARQRLQRLFEQFHITGTNWTTDGPPALCSPTLHITYWSERWFANMPILPQTAHVGGTVPPAPPAPLVPQAQPHSSPPVFITLGTSFHDDLNFFIAATRAVDQIGGIPIVALGTAPTPELLAAIKARLPDTTQLFDRVDFDSTLPTIAGAIHHGGAGTTHALVTHAIPQIVVPHAADQMVQAQGVKRSGVGVYLPPKQVTVERLVLILQAILPEESPARRNTKALQAEFTHLGGVSRAADLLENHLRL